MATVSDVKQLLQNEKYEELEQLDNLKEIINRQSNLYLWTILHEIIKSNSRRGGCCLSQKPDDCNDLLTVENIEFLIKAGAKLDVREINGDTPLHTAVTNRVDESILEALINTKHNDNDKDCEQPCRCGRKALQIANKSGKTPIEIECIPASCLQKLNLEGEWILLLIIIKKKNCLL